MIQIKDIFAKYCFLAAAVLSTLITVYVLGFMIYLSLPVIRTTNLAHILTSPWSPGQGLFGIFPMIIGTLCISFLSMVISIPLSLGCTLFITIVRPESRLKTLIEFMTAVPTVIYGFIGIFLLVPFIREFFAYGSGMCILSASLMLGLMISPTLILFFTQSITNIPSSFITAANALGARPFQKFFLVILPLAWRGILTGVILGFGRAMGDTLIALMISGNAVMLPESVLDSARTLTAHIALVIAADFDSIEFKILFICASSLYLITTLGIMLARLSEAKTTR